jgi:ATP-dependent Lon protease
LSGAALLAIEEFQDEQTMIALIQRDPDQDEPTSDSFYPIGVEIAVGRLLSMPDGSSSALVQGRRRLEIIEYTQEEPYLIARAQRIFEPAEVDKQMDATMRTALDLFQRCVQLDRRLPEEAYLYALNIEEPGWLADMIVTAIAPPLEQRQEVLWFSSPSSVEARGPDSGPKRTYWS